MQTLIPLKSIYTFVAVAETGSMTSAADALNVSHSAVSQGIKNLENQLGQPLFKRVGRKVTLNSQGRKYYQKVAPALEQIVAASEDLQRPKPSNRLTLNMINSLAIHWWIPRVQNFQQMAPQLDVRVSNLVGPFDLKKERVDIALIHGNKAEWQDYYCEKLADDEMVMVCSPELVTQDTSIEQLIGRYPAIYASNARRKDDWAIWCEAHQLPVPIQQNSLNFNVSVHAVQAAIRKLGLFVTHRLFVKDDIKHGALIEIGQPVQHPDQSFYLACHPEDLKLESVLTLRTWLQGEFTEI